MVAESDTFEWKYVRQALTDWQLYVDLFVFWGGVGPLYGKQAGNTYLRCGKHADLYILGISFFLPSIINELGYTATTAQLLTIPIYATAAVVALIVCWASDKAARSGRSRWPYVFGSLCTVLVGYIMAIAGSAGNIPGVVYAGELNISPSSLSTLFDVGRSFYCNLWPLSGLPLQYCLDKQQSCWQL